MRLVHLLKESGAKEREAGYLGRGQHLVVCPEGPQVPSVLQIPLV